MILNDLFPLASLQTCSRDEANALLVAWSHRMGPLMRPKYGDVAHVLLHGTEPVAVTCASTLIREGVGGGTATRSRAKTPSNCRGSAPRAEDSAE